MTVLSNTSPIHYLILIGEVDILPELFGRVLIPSAVNAELRAQGAPEAVRIWMSRSTDWLDIGSVSSSLARELSLSSKIDPGEREAIALASEFASPLLLIDDREGRRVAEEVGIRVVGTLGLLDRADAAGLIADLPTAVTRLRASGFRIAPALVDHVLQRHKVRRVTL